MTDKQPKWKERERHWNQERSFKELVAFLAALDKFEAASKKVSILVNT